MRYNDRFRFWKGIIIAVAINIVILLIITIIYWVTK